MADFGVRVLSRQDGLAAGEPLALAGRRTGVGVSWEAQGGGCATVDLDLQCVVVDEKGVIIDCAYYNNLKAARGITHSGDESAGRRGGIQEVVWINFGKLPASVPLLIFVVAAYSGGLLCDVKDGKLHVLDESERTEVACFELESSPRAVDIVAAAFRAGACGEEGAWSMHILDKPAEQGQHFMDILPLLGEVIRGFLPHAPQRQKVAFAMEKGAVLDLPQDLGKITVGLGWDVDEGEADLDVSAVLLDRLGQDLEAVFFGRLESAEHGVQHSGDNRTGQGDGDDEQIVVRLDAVGLKVHQIVFVINIYTQHRTFLQVASPYCRVVDAAAGSELCRYALRDAGGGSGLIVAKLAREAGSRWGFHALGMPCRGRTYKDSLPEVRTTCGLRTASLMLRSSTAELGGAAPCAPPAPAAAVGPLPQRSSKSSACTLL